MMQSMAPSTANMGMAESTQQTAANKHQAVFRQARARVHGVGWVASYAHRHTLAMRTISATHAEYQSSCARCCRAAAFAFWSQFCAELASPQNRGEMYL